MVQELKQEVVLIRIESLQGCEKRMETEIRPVKPYHWDNHGCPDFFLQEGFVDRAMKMAVQAILICASGFNCVGLKMPW